MMGGMGGGGMGGMGGGSGGMDQMTSDDVYKINKAMRTEKFGELMEE